MARRFVWMIVVSILFLAGSPTVATGETRMKIHRLDATGFPVVKLSLSIEKDGKPVALDVSDFQVAMDGPREVDVASVSSLLKSQESAAVVIALDTSRSLNPVQLETIKRAVARMIRMKGERDRIALVSFNDDVYLECDFTTDVDLLLSRLDKVRLGGKKTVLFKAAHVGLEMLDRDGLPALRYLLVLSDGKDEGVGFSLDSVVEKARASHIPVYSVGFESNAEPVYLDNLFALAERTEGEYRAVRTDADLYLAYASFGVELFKQHVMELDAGIRGDGRVHRLEIRYTGKDGSSATRVVELTAPIFEPPPVKHEGEAPSEENSRMEDRYPSWWIVAGGGAVVILFACVLGWPRRKTPPRKVEDGGIREPYEIDKPDDREKMAVGDVSDGSTGGTDTGWYLHFADGSREELLRYGDNRLGANISNDIVLDADTVSRKHALIQCDGDGCALIDLGSTNGTFLNDRRVHGSVVMEAGDRIRIGPFRLMVRNRGTVLDFKGAGTRLDATEVA